MTLRDVLTMIAPPLFRRKSNEAQAHYDEALSTPEVPALPDGWGTLKADYPSGKVAVPDTMRVNDYGIADVYQDSRDNWHCLWCKRYYSKGHVCTPNHNHRDPNGRFARRPTE